MDTVEMVWTALIIVFLVIEGIAPGLTSIWFAAGAVAGLVASLIGLGIGWQIVAFVIVSAVTLIITRPLARKYVNRKVQPTNADRVVGQTGVVTEDIDNIAGTGAVKVGGKIWTARSENGCKIDSGTIVTAVSIRGVTLRVLANNVNDPIPCVANKED